MANEFPYLDDDRKIQWDPNIPHWHQCPTCGRCWGHPASPQTRGTPQYRAAHTCCGNLVLRLRGHGMPPCGFSGRPLSTRERMIVVGLRLNAQSLLPTGIHLGLVDGLADAHVCLCVGKEYIARDLICDAEEAF